MQDIKEYIDSGIVQLYVMGLATEAESLEFERLCLQYPELVEARTAFEIKLENVYLDNSDTIILPDHLRQGFLEAIHSTDSISQKPKVITMENANRPVRRTNWLAVASVILIIGVALVAYQFHSQNQELKKNHAALQAKFDSTNTLLNQIVAEQKVFRDTNVTVVNMVGTQVAPRSSANIYWDSTSSDVYLVVKNMPKLPNDKQYQLWALIDGKPKDLGVFDGEQEKLILKMTNTQKADAFAITIEQKGGSPSPTLEKMQSMGKTRQGL